MLDVGEQSVESGNVGKTKCIFFPHTVGYAILLHALLLQRFKGAPCGKYF